MFNETDDIILGTKGQANVLKHEITAGGETWNYRGDKPSMYDVEHDELFKSIKDGKPINNGIYMSLQHDAGHHRPHGHLHRPAHHLGRGDQLQARPHARILRLGPVKLPPEALAVAMPGKTVLS